MINKIYIESLEEVLEEYYFSITIDRTSSKIVVLISKNGGIDIEEVSNKQPEKILKIYIDKQIDLMNFHIIRILSFLQINSASIKEQIQEALQILYSLFIKKDMSQLEINPLVLTKQDEIKALDAKISFDDNGLFRQEWLKNYVNKQDQVTEQEQKMKEMDISYVKLNGNIACMVNGAGLAMATMDIIKKHGHAPANFLDVAGSASLEKISFAMKILLNAKISI